MDEIIGYIKEKGTLIHPGPGCIQPVKINDQHACYFIETGLSVLYRVNNPKPLAVISTPQLVGLNHLFYPHDGLKLKIIHSSIIYAIPAMSLLSQINDGNLWSSVATHLSQQIYALSDRKDNKKHTKFLIRQTLKMLQNESEEVRLAHTVTGYIREITGLSHSTVSRSLEILKKEGDIHVKNGILLRCDLR